LGDGIVLLRDQLGRLHVALPRERVSMDEEEEHRLDASFREAIGAFTPPSGSVFVFGDSELAISVFRSEDSHPLEIPSVRDAKLVDHQLLGQDWTRLPLQCEDICKRATFYGMKGGVGRSTALTILALRLASESKNVLVVDLDLESPGLSGRIRASESSKFSGINPKSRINPAAAKLGICAPLRRYKGRRTRRLANTST
jgi:Mrp family chromosome partitioning ATPase